MLTVNCKTTEKAPDFTDLCKRYFDDKNKLNPLDATFSGQNEYNADLQLDMTDSFRKSQKAFYEKYQTALEAIDQSGLNEEEKISFGLIEWETERGLTALKFPKNLMPINHFWGLHLTMPQ